MRIFLPLLFVTTLILTVLFTQARFSFYWDGKTVRANIGFLFFSWTLPPKKKKTKTKAVQKKEKTLPVQAVRSLPPLIRSLFRHLQVKHLCLDLTFGSPDAAKTALQYGTAAALAPPLTEFLVLRNRPENISVQFRPDLEIRQTPGTAEGGLRIRPVFLLIPLLRIAMKGR